MLTSLKILVLVFFIISQILETSGLFRMSKIYCEATDPTYVKFQYCKLKPVNRYKSEFSLNLTILRPSFDNVWVHMEILKKYSAQVYRVIYLNTTFDACAFIKNPKRHPMPFIILNLFQPFTNINHSCPYSGDIIMNKFTLSHEVLSLPVPSGEYLFKSEWTVDKALRVKVYVWYVFEELNSFKKTTKKPKTK